MSVRRGRPPGVKRESDVEGTDRTENRHKRKPPLHPSFNVMIVRAISSINGRFGASKHAIKKFLLAHYDLEDSNKTNRFINTTLRRGVANGNYETGSKHPGHYKVARKNEAPEKLIEKRGRPKMARNGEVAVGSGAGRRRIPNPSGFRWAIEEPFPEETPPLYLCNSQARVRRVVFGAAIKKTKKKVKPKQKAIRVWARSRAEADKIFQRMEAERKKLVQKAKTAMKARKIAAEKKRKEKAKAAKKTGKKAAGKTGKRG